MALRHSDWDGGGGGGDLSNVPSFAWGTTPSVIYCHSILIEMICGLLIKCYLNHSFFNCCYENILYVLYLYNRNL